ncbi:MAG: hypothetical protein H6713_12480 [Myxococcales bacterium]|nr:hypothetical protein [Myxococcales bacterium]MCB9750794.1 hypothetical protein [Myxococcales bacterium]
MKPQSRPLPRVATLAGALALLVALPACDDSSGCEQAFPVLADDGFTGDGDVLSIRLDAGESVTLPAGSRLNVVLWGFDERSEDVEATQLRARVEEISSLPHELELALPTGPHEQIPATQEAAMYYLSVFVELDGDDEACAGDYGVDYDAQGGLNTFTLPLAERVDVPLTILE